MSTIDDFYIVTSDDLRVDFNDERPPPSEEPRRAPSAAEEPAPALDASAPPDAPPEGPIGAGLARCPTPDLNIDESPPQSPEELAPPPSPPPPTVAPNIPRSRPRVSTGRLRAALVAVLVLGLLRLALEATVRPMPCPGSSARPSPRAHMPTVRPCGGCPHALLA
jgi:hypothetical protein